MLAYKLALSGKSYLALECLAPGPSPGTLSRSCSAYQSVDEPVESTAYGSCETPLTAYRSGQKHAVIISWLVVVHEYLQKHVAR